MSASEDLYSQPENFSGKARLFPLPNLVLFPHVLQPLHVFEPRYRQLLEEALADDRLIAMAVLAPGWESDYEGRPALRPVACLGRVATFHKLEGGRYNILLAGLKRVRLGRELPPTKLFREAEVELYEDFYSLDGTTQRSQLQRRLLESFRSFLPKMPEAMEQLEQVLSSDISLGTLTDLIGYTLELDLESKEQLLRQRNVDQRALLLIEHLSSPASAKLAAPNAKNFPPAFSPN